MSTLKTTNIQHPSAADPAIELDAAGKLWLAGGKILQIVRATDSTDRSTSSATFVDASIGVTITPQRNTSAILVIWSYRANPLANYLLTQITDSTNVVLSGAQQAFQGNNAVSWNSQVTLIGYSTPATTSAITYKGRFQQSGGSTVTLRNASITGQLYAIEVSA